jgi:group II intron reverse transcriptase/maturase
MRKPHSLIDKVYAWDNLYRAWRRVRANKGAHGLDRVTIRQFETNWKIHLGEIQRKLKQRRYRPQPVRRTYIPKASDSKQLRPLGIPTVSDRIVGQALLQVLDPLFDKTLSNRSFAFRKGRKASDAIATAIRDAGEGFRFVFDADIKSFFDRIDHSVLMSRVRARLADGRVLDLIEAFLTAGVMEDGSVSVPSEGTPQGGVISPWLANLLLDDLDKAIEAKGWRHVRYADDFVVLCRTRQEAEDARQYVKEVLDGLKLELHDTKSRVTDFRDGFEFLGFHFRRYSIGVRSQSLERFKDKVRTLTQRQQGRNVEAVIADLNPVLRGWAGYFGIAEVAGLFSDLDGWIRMRLRAFRNQRRRRTDNQRIPTRRLRKWGLLSLLECRPVSRLSYRGVAARGGEPWFRAMRASRGVAQSQ